MKVYFHLCIEGFTNTYVIVNDDPNVMEAIIVDPGQITTEIIRTAVTNWLQSSLPTTINITSKD